MAEGKG